MSARILFEDLVSPRFHKVFQKGSIICREGDKGTCMYAISKGRVKVFREVYGVEQILGVLRRGDFFGEMSLLDGRPRSATAVALVRTTLVEIGKTAMKRILAEHPQIALRMLTGMARRLREADDQLTDGLLATEGGKILHALTKLSLIRGQRSRSRIVFNFDLSNQEIADMAGVPETVVERYLASRKGDGLLERVGGKTVVRNLNELDQFMRYFTWRDNLL